MYVHTRFQQNFRGWHCTPERERRGEGRGGKRHSPKVWHKSPPWHMSQSWKDGQLPFGGAAMLQPLQQCIRLWCIWFCFCALITLPSLLKFATAALLLRMYLVVVFDSFESVECALVATKADTHLFLPEFSNSRIWLQMLQFDKCRSLYYWLHA